MAVTMLEVLDLLRRAGKRCFVGDNDESILLVFHGMGVAVHACLSLQRDGAFIRCLSRDIPCIPRTHPSAGAVREEIFAWTYRCKLLRIGWDPSDGTISACADLWVCDGTLTADQLSKFVDNFVSMLAPAVLNIREALATGKSSWEREFDAFCTGLTAGAPTTPVGDGGGG